MSSSKEITEKIFECRQIIWGHKNRIRCATTTMTNNSFYERALKRNNEAIAQLQLENARLDDERHNGSEIISHSIQRIKDLGAKILLLQHEKEIALMIELQRELNEMGE